MAPSMHRDAETEGHTWTHQGHEGNMYMKEIQTLGVDELKQRDEVTAYSKEFKNIRTL